MKVPLQQTWQKKAEAKVAETKSKIPDEWTLQKHDLEAVKRQRQLSGPFIERFLNDGELEITGNDSVPLLSKIKSGQYTALQVTTAFCKRAAIAHQINNCLHEIMFDQAIERAKELDAYFGEHKSILGPLHGLPISLKDQFHVKGVDTTMGYIGWIDTYEGDTDPSKVHKVESQIVTELLSLGAVMYCKTSLPQTLLLGETVNNLIGRTLNPVNQLLSCGGSSGGEGALNALRGSTLGVGTDIGGSVRIPAAFCGIYSVKPTHNRFSYRGAANTNPGQNTYASSVGFLSNSIDALQLVMKSVLSTQPWLRDPEVVPIPWRQTLVDSTLSRASADGSSNYTPLKLGIYWTDGVVGPHPPINRGLRAVVDTLRKAGHKIVDWNPPSQSTAKRVHLAFLKADGAHDIHAQLNLSGEPLIPELVKSFQLKDPMNLLQYQDLTLEGRDYSAAYSDYWNATADDKAYQIVDAVIMPVAPHAAVIPGKYYHTAYTEAINLMDYSAAVIPVTKADKNVDTFNSDYKPLNEIDRKNWEAYDPDVYDGAPIGIQLVARKYEEEKVWAIAKIVSAALETAGVV
jgi:amidase